MEIRRPVLRYHGGKFRLAPWIISHFPSHRVYTEVFGGGGSVLMQKHRSYAEVYNDKWDTVVNVFKVLRDPKLAAELERVLRLTPFSRTDFLECGEVEIGELGNPIEKARRTILRSFAGFGSASTNAEYATGFRSNSNKSHTTPAHDWVNFPDHIKTFTERLKGVIIENRDYREVSMQHDSPQTLHFFDPPYVQSTRNMQRGNASYAHEFTDQDHVDMAKQAYSLQGTVIICGYESALYDDLFKHWYTVKRKALADGARERIECLWINRLAHNQLF